MSTVDQFTRTWYDAVADIGFVPSDSVGIERRLHELTLRLGRALVDKEFTSAQGYEAGAALVAAHMTDPRALEATLRLMNTSLLETLPPDHAGIDPAELSQRLMRLQSALASGYAQALRDLTMTEQERLNRAVLDAHAASERALRASEARLRAIFAGAGTGIGIADMDGRILQVNKAFCRMLGYTADEMTQLNVSDLTHPDDYPGMWDMYAKMIRGEREHVRVLKAYPRKQGGEVWTDLSVSLVRDELGEPRFTVAMVTDITRQYRLQRRLEYQTMHDPLTGLPNRTMFSDRLDRMFAEPEPDTTVGLLYLDLDAFKRTNDTLGHVVGDQLLMAVATRLQRFAAKREHLVARMGGDEFVLMVEQVTHGGQMSALAEELLDTMAEAFIIGPHRLRVSISVGVLERELSSTSPSELLQAADLTLYGAKSDGRGRWSMYDAERNARQIARYALTADLPDAIDRSEFVLVYQPLVNMADGKLEGVEALVRWQHPEHGLVTPDQFIPLAEESGLIVPLGRWVMLNACEQLAAWRNEFPDSNIFVSVNVAAAQAHEDGFAGEVETTLKTTGLDPSMLQLELTEYAVMRTHGAPLEQLRELSAQGIRIAVDDFGTGYSNLEYLSRLPLSTLKLAGSLVDRLRTIDAHKHVDMEVVDTIVRLAHTLGLTVTAEGVETRVQADRLMALGCDSAQGWLYSKPKAADEISDLLAAASAGSPA